MGASDDLMIRDHVKRFIAILLRLGGCRSTTQPVSVPIEVDVNQQDLAGMCNVARTTAGAILRKLKRPDTWTFRTVTSAFWPGCSTVHVG